MHDMLQQAANAMAMGPTFLLHGIQLQRPIGVVRAPALSVDDKRAVLAAWASDFYAVDWKPALRHLPGTPEPISIDEVQYDIRASGPALGSDGTLTAGPGDIVYMPKGETVTITTEGEGALTAYVTYPHWAEAHA